MRSSARNTSENAPSSCSNASRKAPASVRSARMRHQMQNHFGIARRLENRAARFQIRAQFRCVGDVAVVRDRNPALVARAPKTAAHCVRRYRRRSSIACGRWRVEPGSCSQHRVGEYIRHVPHDFCACGSSRHRWWKCRRSPARGAAAHTETDRPASTLRDGRKWRLRRTLRGIYRA